MKKTLYIIRHGETDFNRQNIVQGSGVDTSLNETGRLQAEKFFISYREFPFQKVYTSALQRSIQSVEGFISMGIPHESYAELNEISWGIFEGKQQTEAQRASYWNVVKNWNAGNLHDRIPEGESPMQMYERQSRFVDRLMSRHAETQVLICMHGRALKSMLCLLLNKPLTAMEEFEHTNLGLYVLEWDGNAFYLRLRNDTAHLNGCV